MLQLTASDYREIRRHGEETYPEECCGILLGTMDGDCRIVKSAVRCRNAAPDSPHVKYNIDPRELIPVQREARRQDLELVGFYHSHPDHPALWSATDLEQAHWIGCSYVITAVDKGIATETAAFVLIGTLEEDKQFVGEQMVIEHVS